MDDEEAAGAFALLPFAPLSDADLEVVLGLAVDAVALAARALRSVSLTFAAAPEEVFCCTWPIVCSPGEE